MNIINLFPKTDNANLLRYDDEGLWSISIPSDAEKISQLIIKHINNNNKILDGTAGLGGNVFSFSKYFKNVTAVEIDSNRCGMLENNIRTLNINNVQVYNNNSINYLYDNYDAYFFDPPWGGPDYKYKKALNIKINNYKLIDIVYKIRKNNKSIIFFKLPFNYNLNEFKLLNYKFYRINNYLLVTIF